MKKIILFCFLISLVISCKKKFNITNLNGNKITALGHGGMGIGDAYPMNSYESISKCLSLGIDGTEFDVQMTKDSVLVAFHNENLSYSTNLNGRINSMYWSEVKQAHYNQTPYLNYSVISLDDLFSNIESLDKYKFTFDCKVDTNGTNINLFYETYINAIIKIAEKYQLEKNIHIESTIEKFLALFKIKKPNYPLFIYPSSFEDGLNIASSLGLRGITISTRNISKEQIKIAHDNNLMVAIWNVQTKRDNAEAIKKNPDFIQTDNVKALIKLLK